MALQQKNTAKIFGPRPVLAGQLCVFGSWSQKIGEHKMKKLFYRLSSSRSCAKLFSIHARLEERKGITMSYKKLISAVIIAAFGFCFSDTARADCDNPDFCWDFGIPSPVDNITGSSVKCDLEPGGVSQPFNTLAGGLNSNTGKFTQTGTATCTHLPDNADLGTCDFNLTWTGVSISSCANNSFTAGASCTDLFGGGLDVTGTVTCPGTPPKVMQLGFGGLTQNQCNQVFPQIKQKNTVILPAGKVLDLTITTEGSACTGPFVAISNVKERYCNDGFSGMGVDCTPTGGPGGTTTEATTVNPSAVPFDFTVTQTVNTSPTFCKGGKSIDKGQATVSIFGAANTFDVANINQSSLECEGAPLTCGTPTDLNNDGILDLPCRVNTCPTFGPALGQLPRIAPGVVSATCTGQLNSGTQILGIADVDVSPK
jgi:hypothetical protein